MKYAEYPTLEPLRPLAECAWTCIAGPGRPYPARELVLPDGCVDLIVDLRRRHGFVVGTMTRAHEVTFEQPTRLVAIRFGPGGAFPVLGVPVSELTNQYVDLCDLRGDAEDMLRGLERLSLPDAAVALQRALAERPMPGPVPARHWQALIGALTSRDAPRVSRLSAQLGLSRQHVTRQCRTLVGIGPKRLARIARLRRLVRLLKAYRPGNWAGTALDAGYYDQSHMIGDVKSLTGLTPEQLRRELRA